MEVELVRRKRHWGKQIEGEFLGGKRHVAEKCVQSCLGERRPKTDKILVVWILWRGNGTVQKGSLQGCSGESRPLTRKMEAESVWRKRHWGRQIVGEFLWRKRHVVEKCVQSCL
ncbi:hypothetical protein T11_14830, partial [Trichinella zimbabwensis]